MPECDVRPISVSVDTNMKLGTTAVTLLLCPACDTRRCGARIEVEDIDTRKRKTSKCTAQVLDPRSTKCPFGHDLSLDT